MPQALDKRQLIRDRVEGRSFVDIGGLWGTRGEMVTTALQAGASRAVMADIQDSSSEWWEKFRQHARELGVEGHEELQVDICAPDAPSKLGKFEFVHCSGIMYHVADLFAFVGNLYEATDEFLLLSSVTMPDRINSRSGTLGFGNDHAYLAPLLDPDHKRVVVEYLDENGFRASGLTQDAPFFADGVPQTGPWWWLFSSGFMERVVQLYGMEVLASGPTPTGFGHTMLARRSSR